MERNCYNEEAEEATVQNMLPSDYRIGEGVYKGISQSQWEEMKAVTENRAQYKFHIWNTIAM